MMQALTGTARRDAYNPGGLFDHRARERESMPESSA
jgi:hypothetical protein